MPSVSRWHPTPTSPARAPFIYAPLLTRFRRAETLTHHVQISLIVEAATDETLTNYTILHDVIVATDFVCEVRTDLYRKLQTERV